jgi:hypothetical protein
MQSCNSCGVVFDLDKVPLNPFKRCPNPSCKAPLDADAVEHTFVESLAPNNTNDAHRLDLKAQLHNDVAEYEGADLTTGAEKVAAGMPANGDRDRKITRVSASTPTNTRGLAAFNRR